MDGDEPAGDWATSHDSVHDVLVNKKSNAMLVFILFSTKKTLCPSSVVVSPKFFHLISQSLTLFSNNTTCVYDERLDVCSGTR